MQVVGRARDFPDQFDIVVDPGVEPGDVLGALARLLISIAQDGVLEEQVSEEPVTA